MEMLVRPHIKPPAAPPMRQEGYDEKLFVHEPVAVSKCSICVGVMNDPVCCPQGHKYVLHACPGCCRPADAPRRRIASFCRACLSKWFADSKANNTCPSCRSPVEQVVPNRFAADVISALVLRCPKTADTAGSLPPAAQCTWTGPVRDLVSHQATCVAIEVACVWTQCRKRTPRGTADSHFAECEHRVLFCPHCSVHEFGSAAMTAHAASCSAAPSPCSNPGCTVKVVRDGMEVHRAVCAFEVVPCAVPGCGVSLARIAMEAHMTSGVGVHMQALCGEVLSLRARLDAAEAELRRVAAGPVAAAPPLARKRAKR